MILEHVYYVNIMISGKFDVIRKWYKWFVVKMGQKWFMHNPSVLGSTFRFQSMDLSVDP